MLRGIRYAPSTDPLHAASRGSSGLARNRGNFVSFPDMPYPESSGPRAPPSLRWASNDVSSIALFCRFNNAQVRHCLIGRSRGRTLAGSPTPLEPAGWFEGAG